MRHAIQTVSASFSLFEQSLLARGIRRRAPGQRASLSTWRDYETGKSIIRQNVTDADSYESHVRFLVEYLRI